MFGKYWIKEREWCKDDVEMNALAYDWGKPCDGGHVW